MSRKLDETKAHEKSPTTNRFYSLPGLLASPSPAFEDFRDRLVSMVGITAGSQAQLAEPKPRARR